MIERDRRTKTCSNVLLQLISRFVDIGVERNSMKRVSVDGRVTWRAHLKFRVEDGKGVFVTSLH